jgi:hypothetical protein
MIKGFKKARTTCHTDSRYDTGFVPIAVNECFIEHIIRISIKILKTEATQKKESLY